MRVERLPDNYELRVIIVGTGGFARELLSWIHSMPAEPRRWTVVGCIDDNPAEAAARLASQGWKVPVIDSIRGHQPLSDAKYLCAIGDPHVRQDVAKLLISAGAVFTTFIHHTATVGECSSIGTGTILCPQAVVSANVTVGDFCLLNIGAVAGHDVELGDFCTLSPHTDLGGWTRVGSGVFFGTHATVLPRSIVGDRATVGAGSVVLRRVNPGAKVFGVPAIEMR